MTKEFFDLMKGFEEKAGKNWLKLIKNIQSKNDLNVLLNKYGFDVSSDLLDNTYRLIDCSKSREVSDDELFAANGGVMADSCSDLFHCFIYQLCKIKNCANCSFLIS